MNTTLRAELLGRVSVLEDRGHEIRAKLTLNPGLSARYALDDQVADLADDVADLRRAVV